MQTRGQRLRVLALGTEELAQGIDKGSRVRVKGELIIYHSPKLGASFNLEGKEGTVLDVRAQSHCYCLLFAYPCGLSLQR